MDTICQRQTPASWSPLLATTLALIFVLSNFAIMPLGAFGKSELIAISLCFVAGAIAAQGTLLCCAFVFVEGLFWRRAVACWAAAALLWGCWAAGFTLAMFMECGWCFLIDSDFEAERKGFVDRLQFVGLSLPLQALALQSPLWFFRVYLGWRIVRLSAVETRARPHSISDYFTGMALVALYITFARLAPPQGWIDSWYWPKWVITFVSLAAFSLVIVVPAMFLIFHCRRWSDGIVILMLDTLLAGIMAAGIAMMINLSRMLALPNWRAIGAFLLILLSFAACLAAGLKAARDMGFELAIGRRPR
jgi:hypothetical protein